MREFAKHEVVAIALLIGLMPAMCFAGSFGFMKDAVAVMAFLSPVPVIASFGLRVHIQQGRIFERKLLAFVGWLSVLAAWTLFVSISLRMQWNHT